MVGDLAEHVSALVGQAVQVAFVDVLGPAPSEVLANLSARHPASGDHEPVIVLPAFLSRGYHVRVDLPAHIAASGHPNVTVIPALGPDAEVARIVGHQLVESGWRPGDSVILAAAGTSDHNARTDLHTTAVLLSALTGSRVRLGFAATGDPDVGEAVADARRHTARRVVVASYLLADGLFQERLHTCGADLVTQPLSTHPRLARLIAHRFLRALPRGSVRHRPYPLPNSAARRACRQGTSAERRRPLPPAQERAK